MPDNIYPESEKLAAAVQDFYRVLTPESIGALGEIYHPDVLFTDPAGSIRGLDNLQEHYHRLLDGVRRCDFAFPEGRQTISDNHIVLCWEMTLEVSPLAGGRAFTVEGISLLVRKDDLVIEHRDYFDLGAMFYEQLPLLGRIIRRLRKHLAAHES